MTKGHRSVIFALVILAVAVAGLEAAFTAKGKMSPWDRVISALFLPLQKLSTSVKNEAGNLAGAGFIKSQNERLLTQNENLEIELARLQNDKMENDALRLLLKLPRVPEKSAVYAQIVGRDPSSWFSSMTIDRGLNDGIAPDMGVAAAGGVAGKILAASAHESKIDLITNPNLAVPVEVLPGGYQGIAYGDDSSGCVVKYLPHDAQIKPGDEVVTSKFGRIFPMGIPYGTVLGAASAQKALFKEISVSPRVNFGEIQSVAVFKP